MKATKNFRKAITALLIVLYFSSLSCFASPVSTFWDVKETDWFYDAVVFNVELGVFTGNSENTFSPNSTLTRATVATALGRLAEAYGASIDHERYADYNDIGDIKKGGWYDTYAYWARDCGIMVTFEDDFQPHRSVTREEFAYILCQYLDYLEIKAILRADPEDGTQWINPKWIDGGGMETGLLPDTEDTRQISYGALIAVGAIRNHGLMTGYPNGDFRPQGTLTRAECCQTLVRMAQKYLEPQLG